MTMKNWYGLLGGRRNQFHQDIHGIVSDLALMMKPTLTILDGGMGNELPILQYGCHAIHTANRSFLLNAFDELVLASL